MPYPHCIVTRLVLSTRRKELARERESFSKQEKGEMERGTKDRNRVHPSSSGLLTKCCILLMALLEGLTYTEGFLPKAKEVNPLEYDIADDLTIDNVYVRQVGMTKKKAAQEKIRKAFIVRNYLDSETCDSIVESLSEVNTGWERFDLIPLKDRVSIQWVFGLVLVSLFSRWANRKTAKTVSWGHERESVCVCVRGRWRGPEGGKERQGMKGCVGRQFIRPQPSVA